MEFRLIYTGPLPSENRRNPRAREKHKIRKAFHKQLQELWKQNPLLRRQLEWPVIVFRTPQNLVSYPGPGVLQLLRADKKNTRAKPWVEHLADKHTKYGYRFVPLVLKEFGVTCSLDILFLRRDCPGNLVRSGGDIDNRIKVLIDGLKMPGSLPEIGGVEAEPHENPFFCLLEDDSLITGISVTTDRLLLPASGNENVHDVHLEILVKTRAVDPDALFAEVHQV